MKKVFLTVAFVFATVFSFASDNEVKEQTVAEGAVDCVNVTLSCGVTGCVYVVSTEQLIRHIAFAEAYWCEGGRQE